MEKKNILGDKSGSIVDVIYLIHTQCKNRYYTKSTAP